jgi:hypothetical protein
MENKSLYQITVAQQELFNFILESEGEITPDVEESLKLNAENFEAKIRGCIWQVKKSEHTNIAIDEEIARLQGIKKRNEKLIDRLKESMKFALETFGESKKVDTFTLSISTSKSVEISNMEILPKKYTKKTITITPDKKAIKKAIDLGITVKGATIKENHNLQIK